MGFYFAVTWNFISRTPVVRARVFQRGAISTVSGCPFSDGPDAICTVFCEKETYNKALEVPYQSTLVSCAARGDKECKWVMKPFGRQDLKDESDLGPMIADILNWELPKEMVDSFSVQYLAEFWILATKALIDHLGEERVASMLAPYMKHRGASFGLKRSSASHGAFDLLRITSSICLIDGALHMEPSSTLPELNMVERTIVDCPFREAPVAVCQQFEAFCNGICEAIDPDYKFAYDCMMTKGDKTCHWTIRKKGEATKEKAKEEGTADDPIKRLTNKYIDEEIAKEEYEEKMAIIKKHYPR
jgi:hypothetical protein